MMMLLRDDAVIELFDSPSTPPNWIEAVDVENREYSFCNEFGQRFEGVITRPISRFHSGEFELRPVGISAISNALDLVDRAKAIEPNSRFDSLNSLRRFIQTNPE